MRYPDFKLYDIYFCIVLEVAMDIHTVARFYSELNKDNLSRFEEIYHSSIVFEDAAHRIEGYAALLSYFQNLYQNVDRCQFGIAEQYQCGSAGFLTWTMQLQHPRLAGGNQIDVKGISHLKFDDGKVVYHRDYFDLGEMLYEQLPLLGSVIRAIKQRLGQ